LLSDRLRVVQRLIEDWLDTTAPRGVKAVSACSGDGRDLLEVLENRTDAGRVQATLLESDPRLVKRAVEHTVRAGLTDIDVRCTDAGTTTAYAQAGPADLVLLCGIFGNICDEDVLRTIATTPQLCQPSALVLWTRHRRTPDLTPRIRRWFADHGFDEEAFIAPDHANYSVGAHRFHGHTQPLRPGRRLFSFAG
jgi:hypothetical protein